MPADPLRFGSYIPTARVREEANWRIRLSKETDCFRSGWQGRSPSFQMDLSNANTRIELVTEKEHKQSPQSRTSLKGMDPESLEVHAIKHLARRPTDKWDIPATSAQEAGWLLANPVHADTINPDPGRRRKVPTGGRDKLPGSAPRPGDPSNMWATAPAGFGTGMKSSSSCSALSITMPANSSLLARQSSLPSLPGKAPHDQLKKLNTTTWNRPKGSCDVTAYAEAYVTMSHHSPFIKKLAGR